uniref:Gustatory receptor n=1 Tax=Heliothis virescens TaxID=7102 RepID=A0A2A4JW70_HELVI
MLFHKILWKDEYDERVTFHTRSDTKDFCVALKMIFDQLRRIEKCFSFALVLGTVTVAVGSMVAVQTVIMYIKTSESKIIRGTAMLSWSVASWFHLLVISFQSDLFFRQIEQTKLICAYIQLKPNSPVEILKLTKDILDFLEVRDARVSVYGMFSFNTGVALKIAASTFVYITVQLQLAFPNLKEVHKVQNVSLTPPEFDFDPIKVKEFWFL